MSHRLRWLREALPCAQFAKMLARVVKLSAAFCKEACWLDYKALKKLLHGCEKSGVPLLSSLGES